MIQPKILSLGEVLWDLFPEGARFGGAPANFACHASLLGGEVTMVSRVGDDERGREAIAVLKEFGINTSLMQVDGGLPTGTVGVELNDAGKPHFTIYENSAWDELEWREELESRVVSSDAVSFGTLSQRGESSRTTIQRALRVAASAGIPRILDVNLRSPFFDDERIRDSISLASFLKLSDDEIAPVASACGIPIKDPHQDVLRALLEKMELDLVVMTRGAKGAVLILPDETVHQAGIPTEVRDTVGAGDAFTAAFLLGLLRGHDSAAILRMACERASQVCSMSGAVPSFSQ